MKIGILPSSQRTSCGSGIGNHNERELMIDFTQRLIPKLLAAGHDVRVFYAATEVGSDGAQALVAWRPQICIDLHLDSAGGAPAALLCYQEQRSLAMGLKILAVYCQAMGIRNKGGMLRTPGVSGVAVIRIPEASGIPTALIECGDMDKPDGYNWVEPSFREHASVCMAQAICSYAGGSAPVIKPPQEDEMGMYDKEGTSVFFGDCYVDRYNYFLHTNGESGNVVFHLLEHSTNTERASNGQTVTKHQLHDLQNVAKGGPTLTKSSYALTCTADKPIRWTLREVPK